ncbi:MAG: hypothetical protein ABIR27_07050 [Dokdonella sp.]
MKQQNALQHIDTVKRDSHQRCCLAHVRSLLGAIRTRHRLAESLGTIGLVGADHDEELASPTLHDFHVGELEAAVLAPCAAATIETGQALRFDSPQELVRAKWVFAATLLVPILLMSALLIASGNALDHSMISLLRFSTFLLAIPLTVSGAIGLFQHLARRQS